MAEKPNIDTVRPANVRTSQNHHGRDAEQSDVDIRQLWETVWSGRWLVIVVTLACTSTGLAYAFLAPEWWKAEVVLTPVGKKSLPGNLAQLGGLASLAGIDIPSAGSGEPLAVLKSKSFAREFIEDQHLMKVLCADLWGGCAAWTVKGETQPDIREGVKYFDEKIRAVTEDKKAGTVTLTIVWKDPGLASDWANLLVKRLNDRMRAEALKQAETSIQYLQQELLATSVVSLQQSIGRVLEGEMQSMSLARANEEFAFRLVDVAYPPKHRAWPKRGLVVVISFLIGLLLATVYLFISKSRRSWANHI